MRARTTWSFLGLACAVLVAASGSRHLSAEEPAGKVETKEIPNGEGPPLQATVNLPAKANGCGVVLASGQGGGRERPVVKVTAEALAAAGFTVVRFDWPFFTAGRKQPSEDLSAEADALDRAIAWTRSLPGVRKLLVGGKSLGVMTIGVRVAQEAEDLAGLLLLTPPLVLDDQPWTGAETVARTKVPVLVVCGDADPLCSLTQLYAWAGTFESAPRLVVVPGTHGLTTPPGPDGKPAPGSEERDRENVALCASAVVTWARRFVGS
jgi:predicted alpha/beta-hydrolase family hydrolase